MFENSSMSTLSLSVLNLSDFLYFIYTVKILNIGTFMSEQTV